MNWVLTLRGAAQVPIKKLSLSCGYYLDCNQSCINAWVDAATTNKVQKLRLSLPKHLTLPPCVLSCATLVHLKTNVLWDGDISGVHLPSLKILQIKCGNGMRSYDCFRITNLLASCPVLREFHLHGLVNDQSSISEYEQIQINLSNLRIVKLAIKPYRHIDSTANAMEWIYYLLKKLYNVKDLTLSWVIMQV